ncbi:hypothetical protein [Streptomyces lonarensis]|uniref:Uncharacterized protein n=1 Tax=Streptomyces lonarensis TaxID=700599 RepID=A0A7X6HX71_9ACTN|nr:hypothetical protein [Streptomyces lonarensis]NJQ04241.1 hypothetical protein [Streptomyces lonarensis]
MTISLCKHSFSVLQPYSLFRPSPCIHCNLTHADREEELQQQKLALIHGTAHDGKCGHCGQTRRLYRWQPAEQPWHEVGVELPVSFLCIEGWNAAEEQQALEVNAIFVAATR